MHNLIQELRGNVRVYARVRPFLPADGKEEQVRFVLCVCCVLLTAAGAMDRRGRWITDRPPCETRKRNRQEHPTINVNGHDESLLIAKRDGKDAARLLESHAFRWVGTRACDERLVCARVGIHTHGNAPDSTPPPNDPRNHHNIYTSTASTRPSPRPRARRPSSPRSQSSCSPRSTAITYVKNVT